MDSQSHLLCPKLLCCIARASEEQPGQAHEPHPLLGEGREHDALKVPPQCSWIWSFPRELPNGMGLQPSHAGDGQWAPLSSPPLAWFWGRKEPISSHHRDWKCLWGCHQAWQRRAGHPWPGSDRAEKPEAQQQGGSCRAGHNAPVVDGQPSTETVLRARPCHRCRSHVLINKNKYLTSRKRSFV